MNFTPERMARALEALKLFSDGDQVRTPIVAFIIGIHRSRLRHMRQEGTDPRGYEPVSRTLGYYRVREVRKWLLKQPVINEE